MQPQTIIISFDIGKQLSDSCFPRGKFGLVDEFDSALQSSVRWAQLSLMSLRYSAVAYWPVAIRMADQANDLAIAVCRAGGLGSLPCAMLAPDLLRKEITAVRAVTEAPFNVNFFCHVEPTPDPAIETRWRSRLAAYYTEAELTHLAFQRDQDGRHRRNWAARRS